MSEGQEDAMIIKIDKLEVAEENMKWKINIYNLCQQTYLL